jgi:hypothetical protein
VLVVVAIEGELDRRPEAPVTDGVDIVFTVAGKPPRRVRAAAFAAGRLSTQPDAAPRARRAAS